jgi:branched-chain amino acid aminotransferase
MRAMVNVNGRLADGEHAVVSVFDHGFLFGEGIYETLRTYDGEPFLFERHMRRLRASASMLSLDVPLTNQEIDRRFRDTMTAAQLGTGGREAYLRILVTRGVGELSYDPSACGPPSVVIIAKEHLDLPAGVYEQGVKVVLVGVVRNHPGSVNPIIKSNNLLNNALASQEAYRRGAFEGVMRNYRGELAECTTANLFVVKDGTVLTPPVDAGLLAGITREYLFEVGAALGIPLREQVLHDPDLLDADESFLTSSTRELVPITTVDDRPVGTGRPGPITLALLTGFRKAAALKLEELRG